MKKVYQKRSDDCMKCAYATILDKSYEEIPNFAEDENPDKATIEYIAYNKLKDVKDDNKK